MKVFITTSGTGSRLGDLTKYTNKSMVKIGKKPAISYIIEQYPKDFEFVISLGYFGSHTEQFLKMAYPDRKFTFVWVDLYEGTGSSQVHSQLSAEKYLQEPFIYNDCDTIVENLQNEIPMEFNYNYLVGYKTNSDLYDSFDFDSTTKTNDKINSYKITNLYSKHESLDAMLSYIGIAGIYDYKTFWRYLRTADENDDYKVLSDFFVYKKYKMFNDLRAIEVSNWTDTGSIQGVVNARKNCKDKLNILDKNDQAIFMIDRFDGQKVIKFFAKDGVVDRIVKHGESLGETVHKIEEYSENCLLYSYIDGDLSINKMNPNKFIQLLNYFYNKGLWHSISNANKEQFKKDQHKFYIDKTIERVNRFKKTYNIKEDHDIYVNDILIPAKYTIEYMLAELEKMPEYKNANYTTWHGDFTLDNIIETNKQKWVGIDWRDSFGSENIYGDMLYDFGKMNHNLTLNFSSVYKNLFTVEESEADHINVSILTNNFVYDCRIALKEFVEKQFGINYEFINFMSGLCWVNMSPLHFDPFTKFLFYMGKLTMYISLKKYLNESYE